MLIASTAVTFREGEGLFLLVQTVVSVAPRKIVNLALSCNVTPEDG